LREMILENLLNRRKKKAEESKPVTDEDRIKALDKAPVPGAGDTGRLIKKRKTALEEAAAD